MITSADRINQQCISGQRFPKAPTQTTFDSRKLKNGILLGAGEAQGFATGGGFMNNQPGMERTTQTSRKDLTTDSSYNNLHLPP